MWSRQVLQLVSSAGFDFYSYRLLWNSCSVVLGSKLPAPFDQRYRFQFEEVYRTSTTALTHCIVQTIFSLSLH